MALAFNASGCEHISLSERLQPAPRGILNVLAQQLRRWFFGADGDEAMLPPRRAWVLALHATMAPDIYHSDGCERIAREPGTDYFTVLSYPNTEGWTEDMGGALLIAPSVCVSSSQRRATSSDAFPDATVESAVLRVLPRSGRLVVFSGQLLHRSTPPTNAAPVTSTLPALAAGVRHMGQGHQVPAEARWRYSGVMQLLCRSEAYFGPYDPPGAADHDPGALSALSTADAEGALDGGGPRAILRAVGFAAAVVLGIDALRRGRAG